MNPNFLSLYCTVRASDEFFSETYPKCKEVLVGVAKAGGVAMIAIPLVFACIPKATAYDGSRQSFQEVSYPNELKNASTIWINTGSGDLPMILERSLSPIEKSLHGINGAAKPIPAFQGELKKGTPCRGPREWYQFGQGWYRSSFVRF